MVESHQLFIDGAWRPSSTGETLPVINPFNQEVGAQVPQASEADVKNEMRVAQEETFGPVLSIIPFDDEAEAVQLGIASTYGLAWASKDVSRAMRMVHAMRARRARRPQIHHGQERHDRLLGRGPRPVRHQDMSRAPFLGASSIPEPR